MRLIPLLAAVTLAATAFDQTRLRPFEQGTSAIAGIITDVVSNAPIAECIVRANTLRGTYSRGGEFVTGPDGRFAFSGIAEGTYFVAADCPTHLRSCNPANEASGPPCSPITLFKDQQRSNIEFKLAAGATIRGRVVDSSGKPVPRTGVRIGAAFTANQVVSISTVMTDSDGNFELDRLPGGEWALEVDAPPAPGALRAPLVYYPGVLTREEAGRVEVLTGKVREGVLITIPAVLDSTLTVRIPPPDATLSDVVVAVIRAAPLMTRKLDINSEGLSTIKGLIAGRYVVMATAQSSEGRWADYQSVDFFGESLDIALQLRPTGRIRGRVMADGGGVPPLEGASIGAVWMDNDAALNPLTPEEGPVALDGSFEIAGVFGRRVMQLGSFDPGWRIQAVMHGKTDVTAAGLDVAPNDTAEVTIVVRPR